MMTIYKIGQSAGNQRSLMTSSRILRDYTSNIDRFMLKTSTKCYRTTNYENKLMGYVNVGAYLAGLLEGDEHIDIQREDTETKKVNPSPQGAYPKGTGPLRATPRGKTPRAGFILFRIKLDLYSLFIRII